MTRNGEWWQNNYLYAINAAAVINQLHRAPVIAAWEVDELDEMWIDAFFSLSALERRRAPIMALQKRFDEFRRAHPTYRKN